MSSPDLRLPTASGALVFDVTEAGLMLARWGPDTGPSAHSPWSPPEHLPFLTAADATPSVLTAAGTRHVHRGELIVHRGDGHSGVRLVPDGAPKLTDDGTRTRLSAVWQGEDLQVTMHVEANTQHDAVAQWAEIDSTGADPVWLIRAFGGAWDLPVGPGARVGALVGAWSRELTPVTVDLPAGTFAIGSRQGVTGHTYAPVVTVQPREGAGAYAVALAWSGSWSMTVDAVPFTDQVRVGAGTDDETGVILLEPGATFTTPRTYAIWADDAADLPIAWHRFQRTELRRAGPAGAELPHHPVVYNSWYATELDVRADHQLALAERAAALGAEVFVIDDGWFRGRTSDSAGLGDWHVDRTKFPDGFTPLIDGVRSHGLRFGIWVEPECVNPDSDLYRTHPDWVYRAGDRVLVTSRNQYVLDLGRPEVEQFVATMLRRLLSTHAISYLKWDMNRPVSDGGRPGDPHGREWSIQHTRAYYRLLDLVRAEFPHVTFEACASGGGRTDLEVLRRSDVVWASDETGPRDRLAIQHGFLSAYAASWMSAWVTDEPDRLDTAGEPVSLPFRFLVAMCGVLGVGGDLLAWPEQDRKLAASLVVTYRQIREVVLTGEAHRHGDPADPQYAVEYRTSERRAVMVFTRGGHRAPVRLTGISAGAQLQTLGPDGALHDAATVTPEQATDGLWAAHRAAGDADLLVVQAPRSS
ncbi:alpha-galactosidase [Ruania alkalisoli]|uniref:alpha-galactosidase n=1 Tax=Ruania alkalisoli TaxID=2779775 RepID=A0A7M1SPW2_9MICO|nr:alpha-galactosidase [Ruania alkalisoli]QOR69596.1 alpha-galactosidase [Ruania alkalisoli]